MEDAATMEEFRPAIDAAHHDISSRLRPHELQIPSIDKTSCDSRQPAEATYWSSDCLFVTCMLKPISLSFYTSIYVRITCF